MRKIAIESSQKITLRLVSGGKEENGKDEPQAGRILGQVGSL
jgi:hypothetical protein